MVAVTPQSILNNTPLPPPSPHSQSLPEAQRAAALLWPLAQRDVLLLLLGAVEEAQGGSETCGGNGSIGALHGGVRGRTVLLLLLGAVEEAQGGQGQGGGGAWPGGGRW